MEVGIINFLYLHYYSTIPDANEDDATLYEKGYVKIVTLTYDQNKTSQILRLLKTYFSPGNIPIPQITPSLPESSIAYGKHRKDLNYPSTLDLSHLKRVRKAVTDSENDSGVVEIFISTLSHILNLSEQIFMSSVTPLMLLHNPDLPPNLANLLTSSKIYLVPTQPLILKSLYDLHKTTWPMTYKQGEIKEKSTFDWHASEKSLILLALSKLHSKGAVLLNPKSSKIC